MFTNLAKLRSSVTTIDGFSNINWKDVAAVRALNKALLEEDWGLEVDMKEDRLCPPVCPPSYLRLMIDT
jgi:23S rRNA A1618 N6-methylase RlmF